MTDIVSTTLDDSMTPGRKIKAFIWMGVILIVHITVMTLIHTPDSISTIDLYMISFGAFAVIGGQSMVDAITQWKGTMITAQPSLQPVAQPAAKE